MAKILLAEDDLLVGESTVDGLSAAGHTVEWVRDGNECRERLRIYMYDLVLLDWNMPGLTGDEVCRSYRDSGGNVPIIMLTARDKELEKVRCLDAGADDYVTKPFSIVELNARIRAVLRRDPQTQTSILSLGDLQLDTGKAKATRNGQSVELLAKELALLEFLMRHPGQIFGVMDLLNKVWSTESESTEDAVRQCVARLRKKLHIEGKESPVVTVKGLGYKIEGVS